MNSNCKKFDTTVKEIESINGIFDPNQIYVGEVLKIYPSSRPIISRKNHSIELM